MATYVYSGGTAQEVAGTHYGTRYLVHKIEPDTPNGDFKGVYVSTPVNKKISIYNDTSNSAIKVTIPAGTALHLLNSSQYYNYNFFAYISVVFKNASGQVLLRYPNLATVDEISTQAYTTKTVNGEEVHESDVSKNKAPTSTEFANFIKCVWMYKTGVSSGQDLGWKRTLAAATTLTFSYKSLGTTPDSVDVFVCGCSCNTDTHFVYIRNKNYSWAPNSTGGGGNACGCSKHVIYGENTDNLLWEANGAGSAISVESNGDGKVEIEIPGFTVGGGNSITATSIKIIFKDNSGTTKQTINKTATGTYRDIAIPDGATKVYVEANGTSAHGSAVSKSGTFLVYTKPSVANLQISWTSNSRKTDGVPSNIKADATAKLKDTITWSWSGAQAGINTPIAGYRIFVYKSIGHKLLAGKSRYSYIVEDNKVKLKTTLQDSAGNALNGNSLPLVSGMVIDGKKTNVFSLSYTPNDAVLESTITEYDTNFLKFTTGATGGSLSFNPKAAGFENKDYCIFEVILYYNWKNSESANAVTEYATPITSEPENDCYSGAIGKSCNCYFKNSANVWVRVDDSKTLTGTAKLENDWKEAESIWVKTSSGWKEAEGLWVKTGTNTWSESS